MTELKYRFTYDTLIKPLFVKYLDLLKRIVAEILGITIDSIDEFTITNPDIPPEAIGDKFCKLDINMIVNNEMVNLEVPIVTRAIGAYREVVVSSEFRELERLRADARHNEASALENARREEREKLHVELADKDAEIARLRALIEGE